MKLRRPFRVAYGAAATKTSLFVEIDGECWGEASGSVYYGASIEEIGRDLKTGIDALKDVKRPTAAVLEDINRLKINRSARFALSTAFLHYLSMQLGRYPWEIVNLGPPDDVRTSFTVSISTISDMVSEIKESPYPIIKLKMGFEGDEELVAELRKVSGKSFRIDANGGWSLEKAERMIFRLSQIGVELIEQPTKPDLAAEWRHIKGRSKTPLFIDEGMNTLEDYLQYADYVDGINIKLAKAGGILEAAAIAGKAAKDRRRVMLGCMVESSVAISPALYMASLAHYFDLDGPLLLEEDCATGIMFNVEKMNLGEDIIGGPRMKARFRYAKSD